MEMQLIQVYLNLITHSSINCQTIWTFLNPYYSISILN